MGLVGDMRFVTAVLLTGDCDVVSFSDVGPEIHYVAPKGKLVSTRPDFVVQLVGGGEKWITTASSQKRTDAVQLRLEALRSSAVGRGVAHEIYARPNINETLFDNWSLLSARMNCADPERFDCSVEKTVLATVIRQGSPVTLEQLLTSDGVDSARMLASLGFALMAGIVRTNLRTELLSLASKISTS